MKTKINFFVAALLLASASSALAATHYVDMNSANATPPYTNWTTAATRLWTSTPTETARCENSRVENSPCIAAGRCYSPARTRTTVGDGLFFSANER